jgi:hypothetical protein
MKHVFMRAGVRAADWYLDTGTCFFCEVSDRLFVDAAKGRHAPHCTFYKMTDEHLRVLADSEREKEPGK